MKKLLNLFLILISVQLYAQQSNDKLIFSAKIKPSDIESKLAAGTDDPADVKKELNRSIASISRELVNTMPYSLKSALRNPEEYGLDLGAIEYKVIHSGEFIITSEVIKVKNYKLFKTKISEEEEALFIKKKGITEIFKNIAYTNGKVLVVISKDKLSYNYNDPLLVNDKEEAKSTKSMECTKQEYAKQIAIPIEERDYDVKEYVPYGFCGDYSTFDLSSDQQPEAAVEAVDEAVDAAEEVTEVFEEGYVIESTDEEEVVESTEDYYQEKQWYDIEYYRDYILIDNREVATLLLKNKVVGDASKSFSQYAASNSDIVWWFNTEYAVSVMGKIMEEELLRGEDHTKIDLLEALNILEGNSYYGEVAFNKGKVEVNSYNYGNKEYQKVVKDLLSNRVDKKLVNYLPSSASVYAGTALDLNKTFSILESQFLRGLKAFPYDTITTESWELFKLFLDEEALSKVFNGQVLTYMDGSYDFLKEYTKYEYDEDYNYIGKDTSELVKRPSVFSFLGTDDAKSWTRIANILEQIKIVKAVDGVYTMYEGVPNSYNEYNPKEVGAYFAILDDAVVFSSDKEGLKKIKKGIKNTPSKQQTENFKKYSTYMNVDFDLLSTFFEESELIPAPFIEEMKAYQKVELKGVEAKSGYFYTTFTFEAKNKELNILTQLMSSIMSIK